MSGRRNHLRFAVTPPTHGVVRVLSDAEIERVGREDVCVISRDSAAIDERMVLEVPGDGTDVSVAAQVTETRPVILDNAVRHFLRLRALDGGLERLGSTNGGAHPSYGSEKRLAVIAREFAIRLVNCSRAGCLFEADRALEPGTVGTLSLVIEGHELADHILVVRCQQIAGAGPLHHIGARLLWVETPTAHTIRRRLTTPDENPVLGR
jgi:hypothetical protein